MSGDESDRDGAPAVEPRSRRRYLGAVAALGSVALAGCSGGSGNDGSDGSGPADTQSGATEPPAEGDGGGGCPSLPLSFTEQRVEGSPAFAFEGPADATYSLNGQGTDSVANAELTYKFPNDDVGWLVIVSAIPQERPTVDEAVEADSYGQSATEVTGEYDLASANTRVFFLDRRSTHEVYVPSDPVALQVGVEPLTPPDDVSCPDAANATIDRIVETVRSIE
jgi:hypothetical protein